MPREVFRDDFHGTALDTDQWAIIVQNNGGGGEFTRLTKMLAANVSVSGGRLHLASKRHCVDPYPQVTTEHPEPCPDGSSGPFYSGAWLKTKSAYAGGRGSMAFLAAMPAALPGTFPALWARNSESGANYAELDLIETWWDAVKRGEPSDPNRFAVTTWVNGATTHTTDNLMGPVSELVGQLHVWEVEWNAGASPPSVSYFYRDVPEASRVLLRTVTAATPGLSTFLTDASFRTILEFGFRPYIDFAVQPPTTWHVGPDAAAAYQPEALEVEAVLICAPR